MVGFWDVESEEKVGHQAVAALPVRITAWRRPYPPAQPRDDRGHLDEVWSCAHVGDQRGGWQSGGGCALRFTRWYPATPRPCGSCARRVQPVGPVARATIRRASFGHAAAFLDVSFLDVCYGSGR